MSAFTGTFCTTQITTTVNILEHQHIFLCTAEAEAVWLAPAAPQAAGTRVHRLVLDLCSVYRFDMSPHGHIFFSFSKLLGGLEKRSAKPRSESGTGCYRTYLITCALQTSLYLLMSLSRHVVLLVPESD